MSDLPTLGEACLSIGCGHCRASVGEPCVRNGSGKKIDRFHVIRSNKANSKLMSLRLNMKFSNAAAADGAAYQTKILKLQPISDRLNEAGKRQLVDIIEFIAMHGLYPGEVIELMDALIVGSTGRPMHRGSPRIPLMDELVRLCRERGMEHRK